MSDNYHYIEIPPPVTVTHPKTGEPIIQMEQGADGDTHEVKDPWELFWMLYVYVFTKTQIIKAASDKKPAVELNWRNPLRRMRVARRIEDATREAKPGTRVAILKDDWRMVTDWFEHSEFTMDVPHNTQLQPLIDAWMHTYDSAGLKEVEEKTA